MQAAILHAILECDRMRYIILVRPRHGCPNLHLDIDGHECHMLDIIFVTPVTGAPDIAIAKLLCTPFCILLVNML